MRRARGHVETARPRWSHGIVACCAALLATLALVPGTASPAPGTKSATLALDRLRGDAIVTAGTSGNAHLAATDPSLVVEVGGQPVVVLVKLDYDALASYDGSRPGLAATSPSTTGHPLAPSDPAVVAYSAFAAGLDAAFAAELAARVPSAVILRAYHDVYGGVAVLLPANQVKLVVTIPGVIAVQRNLLHQPATGDHGDRDDSDADDGSTDDGSGAAAPADEWAADEWATDEGAADEGAAEEGASAPGMGVRVAVLDSGLSSEDTGEQVVSAERFLSDYDAAVARGEAVADPLADSTGDATGHGTQVAAAIAATAPGAELAIAKVCGPSGCLSSDVLSGLAAAVTGGAGVVSLAVTGGVDILADPVELALLDVHASGATVAVPAGNDGPLAGTVQHRTPWVTTVGAALTDDETGDATVAPSSGRGAGSGVSKPDLVAPATGGTSLASATVAGAAAVLLAAHPDWSPGAIQSALTTTARPVIGATPFDAGAGLLDLDAAQAPGLVFTASPADLGRLSRRAATVPQLNVATVSVPDLPGVVELTRTAVDVSGEARTYDVSTTVPQGGWIQVAPTSFSVDAGGSATLHIQIGTASLPPGWYFGEILLTPTDGGPAVRLPVSFQRTSAGITVANDCDASTTVALGTVVHCTVTASNATTAPADVRIMTSLNTPLSIRSVQGAERTSDRLATALATLPGAQPSAPDLVPSPGSTFVDLTQLPNIEPVPLGDDVGINFTLPEFWYGNERATRIGIVSNGYAVVGGVDDLDVSASPQVVPDGNLPNNVLAPFWTDLEGRDGKDFYAATITDASGDQYAVFQWNVQLHGRSGEPRVFQLWVGLNDRQEIAFVYDPMRLPAAPAGGRVAVGAENATGDRGVLLDPNLATGPTRNLAVVSDAGSPAGSYTFTVDVDTNELATGDVTTLLSSPSMQGFAADGLWFDIVEPPPPAAIG